MAEISDALLRQLVQDIGEVPPAPPEPAAEAEAVKAPPAPPAPVADEDDEEIVDEPDADGEEDDATEDDEPVDLEKELAAARKRIADLNKESERHRRAKAKAADEAAAARAELAALRKETLLSRVAGDLPDDLRALVRGDSAEEMEASAALLRKYVGGAPSTPAPRRDVRGGLDPAIDTDPYMNTPVEDIVAQLNRSRF